MPVVSLADWAQIEAGQPQAHLLQSAPWAELKSGFGWQPAPLIAAGGQAAALVLLRRLPLGLSVAYIPRGPLLGSLDDLRPELDQLCRSRRAVFLLAEPDGWGEQPAPAGFILAKHSVQPPRTIAVDLRGSEDDILARMKQKTRYNIRLAIKKDVTVSQSSDLAAFQELIERTGARDGFGVHSQAYYQRAYDLFAPQDECALLIAAYDRQPLAGLMVFRRGERAWYLYGASGDAERNRMPTYLLQWEAMRWARQHGCTSYDLWGVPDEDETTLEAQFEQRSDGLWGVYRFKRGFGGQVLRSPGPWVRVYNPLLYRAYLWMIQRRGQAGD